MLILVVVPLSIWKMGQLLRYSCCPVVVLPDTLVNRVPFSFQRDTDQIDVARALGGRGMLFVGFQVFREEH